MDNIVDIFEGRGFVEALTSDELKKVCSKPIAFYHGIDPTADSLHLGNLVGLIAARWMQKCGHRPYLLIGGGTALIGDPSGKDKERPQLTPQQIALNVKGIEQTITRLLDFSNSDTKPVIVNNLDWLNSFTLIEFLRDVGKQFRMGPMLAKESVKTRLNSPEGISFTEFTYQALQGYDFLHLYQKEKVCLQIGGSDQWGNITAGTELVRKVLGKSVFGLTYPLLTRSDGKKFGKSESGAIWLDSEKTSYYDFYQYFMKVPDSDVPKLMRALTFMDLQEIASIEEELSSGNFEPNKAQIRLAQEMTRMIHGEEGVKVAEKVTSAAKIGAKMDLDPDTLEEIAKDFPKKHLRLEEVLEKKYVDLCVKSGLLASKGEASRLIKNNGAYLNNEKVVDPAVMIQESDLVGGKFLILGAGKKKKLLVKIERT